jgi:carboxylesterase
MTQSEDEPDQSSPDTSEFFFPGRGISALLIHGLSGTPFEMRFLGERLAAAGVRVLGVRLAGHAGTPEDLAATAHRHWYESVVEGFERLLAFGDPNVVVGLSMGALLAARLAADQRDAVAGVVMLAPAFFLPTPTRLALRLMRPARALGDKIFFRKSGGSDIHDAAARQNHPGTRLMPLGAAMSLLQLSDQTRMRLAEVNQPALVIHGRQDHTCPYDLNADFVIGRLGSANKRLVALGESYHVITVDSEKERVAAETAEFVLGLRQVAAARASG